MKKRIRSHLQYCSLRKKIGFVFGMTMMLVCLVNLVTYMNLNRLEKTVNSVYDNNRNLQQILTTMEEIQSNVYAYLNTRGTDDLEGYYRASADFREYMEAFNDQPTNDSIQLREKNIRSQGETWLGFTEQAINAKRGRDIACYGRAYQQAEEVYQYLQVELESLSTELFSRRTEQYQMLSQSHQRILVLSICESLMVLLFNLLALLCCLDHFTQPLDALAGHAEQVGKGELDLPPLTVQSHDEVGIVSDAFNRMVQSLQKYIVLLRQQMEAESRLKEENLLMEVHLKDAQMGALQARINPHFLYNTMNAGAQLAMMEDADRTYALNTALDEAAEAGVPVIAYDRLIKNDAVSYYVSFDNYTVGTLQGQFVIDKLDLDNTDKTYNMEFTAGDPADNNAGYFFNGAFDTLKPYIDSGKLNVVSGQKDFNTVATEQWNTDVALERAQNILGSYYADGTQLDVWLCSNDSTALGVAQAIESDYKGNNDIIITGQDGDEANLKNIVDGKQTMTVYKNVSNECIATLDLVNGILDDKTIDQDFIDKAGWEFDCVYDTTSYQTSDGNNCNSLLLVPAVITKDNLQDLVDTGLYTMGDDGYLSVAQ